MAACGRGRGCEVLVAVAAVAWRWLPVAWPGRGCDVLGAVAAVACLWRPWPGGGRAGAEAARATAARSWALWRPWPRGGCRGLAVAAVAAYGSPSRDGCEDLGAVAAVAWPWLPVAAGSWPLVGSAAAVVGLPQIPSQVELDQIRSLVMTRLNETLRRVHVINANLALRVKAKVRYAIIECNRNVDFFSNKKITVAFDCMDQIIVDATLRRLHYQIALMRSALTHLGDHLALTVGVNNASRPLLFLTDKHVAQANNKRLR